MIEKKSLHLSFEVHIFESSFTPLKFTTVQKFCDFIKWFNNLPADSVNGWDGENLKADFARKGRAAMKALAAELGLAKFEVRFNPAGPATSGDLVLHGTHPNGKSIYLNMNQFGFASCYFRRCRDMKDYGGEANQGFDWNVDPAVNVKKMKWLLGTETPFQMV